MPADNQVSVTAVRALGSEVEVELRPARPIPNFFPVALRLRYCVFRREMAATADVAGTGKWVNVDSTRPIVLEVPLPFVTISVVAGRDRWAWARDTFALLPPDPRGEEELIRHLFGPAGGELLLPVGQRGISGFPGGLILADVNKGLFVRDRAGRWRYAGECPGWNPVVVDGGVYCTGHGVIRSRPLANPKAPWERVCDEPPVEKGAELRYHFVAGGKLGVAVYPHKILTLSGKPAAIWEQVENPHWHDGMTGVGGQLYGYDQKRLYSRPFADPKAVSRPIFGIAIDALGGNCITSPCTRDVGMVPDRVVGEGHVDVLMTNIALMPGTFDLHTSITDFNRQHTYDHLQVALRFDVMTGRLFETGSAVTLRPEWSMGSSGAIR